MREVLFAEEEGIQEPVLSTRCLRIAKEIVGRECHGIERIRDSTFITYSTDKGLSSNASGPVYVDGKIVHGLLPKRRTYSIKTPRSAC